MRRIRASARSLVGGGGDGSVLQQQRWLWPLLLSPCFASLRFLPHPLLLLHSVGSQFLGARVPVTEGGGCYSPKWLELLATGSRIMVLRNPIIAQEVLPTRWNPPRLRFRGASQLSFPRPRGAFGSMGRPRIILPLWITRRPAITERHLLTGLECKGQKDNRT
jgi:hypothetical protein